MEQSYVVLMFSNKPYPSDGTLNGARGKDINLGTQKTLYLDFLEE